MKKLLASSILIASTLTVFATGADCELQRDDDNFVACKARLTGQEQVIFSGASEGVVTIDGTFDSEKTAQVMIRTLEKLGDKFADCSLVDQVFTCQENNILKRITNKKPEWVNKRMVKL